MNRTLQKLQNSASLFLMGLWHSGQRCIKSAEHLGQKNSKSGSFKRLTFLENLHSAFVHVMNNSVIFISVVCCFFYVIITAVRLGSQYLKTNKNRRFRVSISAKEIDIKEQ